MERKQHAAVILDHVAPEVVVLVHEELVELFERFCGSRTRKEIATRLVGEDDDLLKQSHSARFERRHRVEDNRQPKVGSTQKKKKQFGL